MLRRSPRALVLWAAAVAVALATAVVVGGDLAALHRRAHDLGSPVDTVVARHDLAVGDTVAADDLAVRRGYRSQLPADAVRHATDAVGRVVTVAVLRDDVVTARHLAPRRRRGLDGVIPVGMRAIRIVVTESLRPRPGAAVDVLATPTGAGGAPDSSATTVVAEGVVVIGTDSRATSATGRAASFGVTLLVDPDAARSLAGAEATGVVTLALVPPEDTSGR